MGEHEAWPSPVMATPPRSRPRLPAPLPALRRRLAQRNVRQDGTLPGRRVWARLDHAPDGICADADGAPWVASVPGRGCVHVAEGGEVLDVISVDRGCFARMLGGEDGWTLFIAAAQ